MFTTLMGGTLQNTSAHIVYRHLSEGGENVVVFGVVVHGQAKREIFSSRKTRVFSSHMTPPPSLSLSLQHVIESVKLFFLLTRFFPVFLFIHTFFFRGGEIIGEPEGRIFLSIVNAEALDLTRSEKRYHIFQSQFIL